MTHFIDKDALVAEIERRGNICKKVVLDLRTKENKDYYQGKAEAYKDILDTLDTLEVKEVDLEKEIKEEYLERRHYGGRFNMLIILNESQFNDIAKHFFELGLKAAQKGE